MNTLWPLVLIGVGGYWIWRSMISQNNRTLSSSPSADPSATVLEKEPGE